MEAATTAMMGPPVRDIEQRMEALAEAQQTRMFRARVKRDIAAGKADVVRLLLEPPKRMETMQVYKLLVAIPGVGRVKVNRALTHCRVSPSKTLGGLSERQRGELAGWLRAR